LTLALPILDAPTAAMVPHGVNKMSPLAIERNPKTRMRLWESEARFCCATELSKPHKTLDFGEFIHLDGAIKKKTELSLPSPSKRPV
jgi:hypothetical protein